MGERKLIIPAEVKVCATCTYWDGERRIDDEVGVVVVGECSAGECLVKEEARDSLNDARYERGCLWEDLQPDADDAAAGDEPDAGTAPRA